MDISEIRHRMRPIMGHDPGVKIKESHLRQLLSLLCALIKEIRTHIIFPPCGQLIVGK